MTDKDRTKVDVWNSVGNEICSSLGDNSEVQNALGQNITFFDVISEQTHQRNEWFGGYKILSVSGFFFPLCQGRFDTFYPFPLFLPFFFFSDPGNTRDEITSKRRQWCRSVGDCCFHARW
eukprot:TRINITY_DN1485_c0_g1_i3.p1 TRINITY_DN1485_c0_g1~~TRINITY_DN1485_c0_g1_i3.p1  ORF type:complete len:120 (-),score=20.99 TRINITY_DN1485_c0_g1_i3:734-1093(-)